MQVEDQWRRRRENPDGQLGLFWFRAPRHVLFASMVVLPTKGGVGFDVGFIALEYRRYARSLDHLACV